MELEKERALLDRPLVEVVNLDGERAAYLAILLLAVASRFWDLGARCMSFDETTHALYSCNLYSGQGPEGDLLATFGRYGFEPDAFSLPTGIDVTRDGSILVADTNGQRIVKLKPLP